MASYVFNLSVEFLRIKFPNFDAKVRSIAGEKVNFTDSFVRTLFAYYANFRIRQRYFYRCLIGIIPVVRQNVIVRKITQRREYRCYIAISDNGHIVRPLPNSPNYRT